MYLVWYQKLGLQLTIRYLLEFKPKFIPPRQYREEIQNRILTAKQTQIEFTEKNIRTLYEIINKRKEKEFMYFEDLKIKIRDVETTKGGLLTGYGYTDNFTVRVKAFGDIAKKIEKNEGKFINVKSHIIVEEYKEKYYISMVIDDVK